MSGRLHAWAQAEARAAGGGRRPSQVGWTKLVEADQLTRTMREGQVIRAI